MREEDTAVHHGIPVYLHIIVLVTDEEHYGISQESVHRLRSTSIRDLLLHVQLDSRSKFPLLRCTPVLLLRSPNLLRLRNFCQFFIDYFPSTRDLIPEDSEELLDLGVDSVTSMTGPWLELRV